MQRWEKRLLNNDKKVFVNLSNRPFESKVYNETSPKAYSYKPDTGFWGAIKKDNGYFSEWDREYGLFINMHGGQSLYVTSFVLNPEKVYILRPSEDELILEGFNNFIESKSLTTEEKRRLLVAYLRDKKGTPEIEHIICQIDSDIDMIQLERIFGNFDRGGENGDEVFRNLGLNMRKAFVECFSGVEVTEDAINEDDPMGYDIINCAMWTEQEFPRLSCSTRILGCTISCNF